MEKGKLIDVVRAALINNILRDIIRETQGEETLKELEELTTLRRKILQCVEKPKEISHDDVVRFNILAKKLFPERGERDAEADMDQ